MHFAEGRLHSRQEARPRAGGGTEDQFTRGVETGREGGVIRLWPLSGADCSVPGERAVVTGVIDEVAPPGD